MFDRSFSRSGGGGLDRGGRGRGPGGRGGSPALPILVRLTTSTSPRRNPRWNPVSDFVSYSVLAKTCFLAAVPHSLSVYVLNLTVNCHWAVWPPERAQ